MSDTSSPFQPPPFARPEFASAEPDDLEEDLEPDDEDFEGDDLDEDDGEDEDEDEDDGEDEEGGGGAGDEANRAVVAATRGASRAGDSGGAARAVLEHVARSIVDEPDSVVVEVGEGRSGVKLSLRVAPSDMGRIIGKRGRVAQALRTVVRAAAASEGTDASVDIVD